MKRLYLQRHAESESGEREDPTRALTAHGREQCVTMGRFLAREVGTVDIIITSYFERARQTAEAMGREIGCKLVIETPALEPASTAAKAWRVIQELSKGHDSVLVVSHHPVINELLQLLTGAKTGETQFHHAHIAKIVFRGDSDAP